jgi:predicted O-methyltransferase YrrM
MNADNAGVMSGPYHGSTPIMDEQSAIVNRVISDTLRVGSITLPNGQQRKFDCGVSLSDALQLAAVVRTHRARYTAETGMGDGISSLAICAALRSLRVEGCRHIAIDPLQLSAYGGAALCLLKQNGLDGFCRLMAGPTHTEAPKLILEGLTLDFAFIDGHHTFDYAFIDFFMLDKMLKPGGIVAFHDSHSPQLRRVINFIRSHRKYKLLPYQKVPLIQAGKSVASSMISRGNWWCYADRRPALIFLEKLEAWELGHPFSTGIKEGFYKRF